MVVTVRPTREQVVSEIGELLRDAPAFVAAPLCRRWHLHWGATRAEVADALPGDSILPRAQFQATRAITIEAPPELVWPWLVQVGARRAGWYSHDLLDNLGRPSATTLVPELQQLEVGQWVAMAPSGPPTPTTAFTVAAFEPDEWLLWTKPDSTWAWRLTRIAGQGTRLVTRVRAVYDWRRPLAAVLSMFLMEFGDFAMQRKMLRGIKCRAEGLSHHPMIDQYSPLITK